MNMKTIKTHFFENTSLRSRLLSGEAIPNYEAAIKRLPQSPDNHRAPSQRRHLVYDFQLMSLCKKTTLY